MVNRATLRQDAADRRAIRLELRDGAFGEDGSPEAIAAVERLLRVAGFEPGIVDGRFTPRTLEAIKQFQRAIGVGETGTMDQATYERLSGVLGAERKNPEYNVRGERDARVRRMEARLDKLGYDVGAVDGVYDGDTARGVRRFKLHQKEIEGENGDALGTNGQRVLRRESNDLAHDPYTRRWKKKRERPRLDALTARRAENGIEQGDEGRHILNIKERLRAAGFDPQTRHNRFDDRTRGAVEAYQRREGLPETGEVDRRTWSHLRRQVIYSNRDGAPAQREGEFSSAVLRSERMLKKLGLKPGRVDGLFDRHTLAASRRFERKYDTGGNDGAIGSGQIRAMAREVRERELGPTRSATAYVNGAPRKIKVVTIDGKPVEVDTAKAFLRMERAAKKDGIDLRVVSGFRTMAEQRYLYNLWLSGRGNQAAPPGYSNHQSGTALDLNTTGPSDSVGSGPVYNWLARNAHRFGFRRIPSEHWHWEYQG